MNCQLQQHDNKQHHSVSVGSACPRWYFPPAVRAVRVTTYFRFFWPVWVDHYRFKCPQRGSWCFPACGVGSKESLVRVEEKQQVNDVE